ncbi:MAG: hypothetical protein A3F11_06530 [Gammaproteobacteria bacterium RIFCSPHIGHO2_12_FULL_37_14]|nr:MAG: hypothetical protein A3F11_06530 [Gammaproteobacteria bacterium RIFCSPHIGHO2_12_FULL_37_14]
MTKIRILSPLLVVASLGFSLPTYAVAPGFYVGLAAGPATNSGGTEQLQLSNQTATTPGNPRSNQFGGRAFAGYDIGQYAGIEAGIDYISPIRYKTASGTVTCSSATLRVRDFDVLGKAQVPIKMIDVYGKAGLAVIYFTKSGDIDTSLGNCYTTNTLLYKPMVSIGASYDLSQNWVADASWSRIMVSNIVSSVDFYSLGISYHFVDKYCGQFLCD